MDKAKEVERSIIKKYRKKIWGRFIKGVTEYQLIQDHDKIAVCISGGKDSFLLAKCMQELKRHGKIDFELEFIVMDPGYQEKNRNLILHNAKELDIPITLFSSDIFKTIEEIAEDNPCYLCARMRRGCLYSKAKELGCNKIALGHHFDDVIETILLSMIYSGEIKTMMPKLHSENYEGMELIRPLYYVKEADIISWKNSNDLTFLNCACTFTEKCAVDEMDSKRKEMKALIQEFRKKSKYIDINIFRSVENINLDAIIAYRKNNEKHHFLDDYEK